MNDLYKPEFEEEDDIIVISMQEPLQPAFIEGEDEIITFTEKSPEDSIGEQEDYEETIVFKDTEEGGTIIIDPDKLRNEADENFGSGHSD